MQQGARLSRKSTISLLKGMLTRFDLAGLERISHAQGAHESGPSGPPRAQLSPHPGLPAFEG